MKAKLGIALIVSRNDDLPELSRDVALEQCLSEAMSTGFAGMETGHRLPMDAVGAIGVPFIVCRETSGTIPTSLDVTRRSARNL